RASPLSPDTRTAPSPDTRTAVIYPGRFLCRVAAAIDAHGRSYLPCAEALASTPPALTGRPRRNFSATVHIQRALALAGRSTQVACRAMRRRTSISFPRLGRRYSGTALALSWPAHMAV